MGYSFPARSQNATLIQHRNSQLFGLGQLAAGLFAGQHIAGLFAHASPPRVPPCARDRSAPASSRDSVGQGARDHDGHARQRLGRIGASAVRFRRGVDARRQQAVAPSSRSSGEARKTPPRSVATMSPTSGMAGSSSWRGVHHGQPARQNARPRRAPCPRPTLGMPMANRNASSAQCAALVPARPAGYPRACR